MPNKYPDKGLGPQLRELERFDFVSLFANHAKEQMGLDDTWHYRPLPNVTLPLWNEFVKLVGEDNLRVLSLRHRNSVTRQRENGEVYQEPAEDYLAGSFFVNNQGLENLSNETS